MKSITSQKLQWHKAGAPAAAIIPDANKEKTSYALLHAIQTLGQPRITGSTTAREEAIGLLQVAAEVEHDFVVQYLYAAYSLDDSLGPPVSNWRERILQTAREEMGHLISVQNLLLLLGGTTYFERGEFSEHPTLFPFPLALEPLSLNSLEKYIQAESPLTEDTSMGAGSHVGVIYAMLYWLFQGDDEPQGPWQLPRGIPFPSGHHIEDRDLLPIASNQHQTSPEDWRVFDPSIFVEPATVRMQALESLFKIAKQGEGPIEGEDSHFQDFLKIRQEVKAHQQAGNGRFTRDIPTNPVATWNEGAPANSIITHPQTNLWARLFNCRYQMLLLEMSLAMSFKKSDVINGTAVRAELAGNWSVSQEMVGTLSRLADVLMQLPKDKVPIEGGPKFAGPPFQPSPLALPPEELDRWLRYRALTERSHALIQLIQNDAGEQELLTSILTTDQSRIRFVQNRIEVLQGA